MGVVIEPKQALVFLIGWMFFLIVSGIFVSWSWVVFRVLTGRNLFPEGRIVERRKAPWASGTVLLVFLLYIVANLMGIQGYVWATGGMSKKPTVVGAETPADTVVEKSGQVEPDRASEVQSNDSKPVVKPASQPETPVPPHDAKTNSRELSLLELMSVQAAVSAFLIVLFPLILRATSGARLRDLGLSLDRWPEQIAVSFVAVLVLLPVVYGAQFLALRATGPLDDEFRHPLEKLLRKQFSGEVAGLAFLTAVVLAPLFEELLFRGIFQNWLVNLIDRLRNRSSRRSASQFESSQSSSLTRELDKGASNSSTVEGPDPIDPIATIVFAEPSTQPSLDGWPEEFWEEEVQATKVISSPMSVWFAIVITSLIFASLHAGQWPAPVPIFILALGLGYIYHRTGSLLASICMHGFFNGVSTLMLFFVLLAGVLPPQEKKHTPPPVAAGKPTEEVKSVAPDVDRQPASGKK